MFGFGDLSGQIYNEEILKLISPIYTFLWYENLDDSNIKTLEYVKGISDLTTNKFNNILAYNGIVEDIDMLYDSNIRAIKLKNNLRINLCNIQKLNSRGICIDCCGLDENEFDKLLEYTKKPVFTTIGNSKNISQNNFNFTKENLIRMKYNDGLVGINLDNNYLTGFIDRDYSFEYVFKHIDYIVNIIGYKNICITSNFGSRKPIPWEIQNIGEIYVLRNWLIEYYGIEITENIMHKNIFKFLCNTLI